MFSISLLGIGSPYMGHYIQVQVACHLQGHSLDDDESWRLFCLFICITCTSSQGLILYRGSTLLLCNQVLTWKAVKPIGHLLLLLTCNTVVKFTLMKWNGWFLLYQCMSKEMGFVYYFEGVTTWYQSVPGSNTLGTWEVVRFTMGVSRLIET